MMIWLDDLKVCDEVAICNARKARRAEEKLRADYLNRIVGTRWCDLPTKTLEKIINLLEAKQ